MTAPAEEPLKYPADVEQFLIKIGYKPTIKWVVDEINKAYAAGLAAGEKKEREKWEKEYPRKAAHFPPGWGPK